MSKLRDAVGVYRTAVRAHVAAQEAADAAYEAQREAFQRSTTTGNDRRAASVALWALIETSDE